MDQNAQSKDKTFADALRTGNLGTVKRLLNSSQHPISPTTTSISPYFPPNNPFSYGEDVHCHPLAVAAMFSHPHIVSHLLSLSQDFDAIDAPASNLCQCLYDPVDPRALVDPDSWQDPSHWTALHLAICQGGNPVDYDNSPAVEVSPPNAASSLRIVKDLLEAGASLTVPADQPDQDQGGITILHTAALKGRADILSYLAADSEFPRKAEVHALINARDRKGRTPLHYAALRYSSFPSSSPSPSPDSDEEMKERKNQEKDLPHPFIGLLLSAGADLEARDMYSQTPFTLALSFGCYSSASTLLFRGAHDDFRLWFPHTDNLCFPLQVLAHSYETFFLSGTPAPVGPVSRNTWEAQRADLLETITRISPPPGISYTDNAEGMASNLNEGIDQELLHPLCIAARDGSNPCSILSLIIDHLQQDTDPVDLNAIRCGSQMRWTTPLHEAVKSKPATDRVSHLRIHPDYDPSSGCMRQGEDPRWILLPQDPDQHPEHDDGVSTPIRPEIHSQRELHQWAAVLKCVVLVSRGARLRTVNSDVLTPLDLAIRRSEKREGGDCTYQFVRSLLFNLILPHKRPQGQQSLLDAEDERYLAEKLREVVMTNPSLALAMVTAGVSPAVYFEERETVLSEAEELSPRTSVENSGAIGDILEGRNANGGGTHTNGGSANGNGGAANGNGGAANGHGGGAHARGGGRRGPFDAIRFMELLLYEADENLEVAMRKAIQQGMVL